MLQSLINQAKAITSADADTKFEGALIQVCHKLSLDECEKLFVEAGGNNEQKHAKMVERCKAGYEGFSINAIRNTAVAVVKTYLVRQERAG